MTVFVTTVETITKRYQMQVADGTTDENALSRVEETEEERRDWIECEFTAIESLPKSPRLMGKCCGRSEIS